MQQIFPSVKEPSKPVYDLASFLFDEDPLLSKRCRKRINKIGDPTRILKFKKEGELLVAQKNIVLGEGDDKLAKK
jgi:protocatechuate 3,4-dioxygenase beta subunit